LLAKAHLSDQDLKMLEQLREEPGEQ